MEQKYSFSLTDNTTYTGKDLEGFYSTALLTGETKSIIKLVPNVKSKVKIASLDLGNVLQADSCSFSDSGTSTLAQKTLEVGDLKVNLEFCSNDFEINYLSEQLRPGSNNGEIPQTFTDYIMSQVALRVSQQTEDLLWNGVTASITGSGFLLRWDIDSAVIDVAGTTLSASNIITEIGKLYAAIPNTIINRGRVKIFMSVAASKFYKQALAAANPALIAYNFGDFTLKYIDIDIVVAPGLPTNVMCAAEPENLWFGTDMMDDFAEFKIIPLYDTLGERKTRIVGFMKFGVNYGVGAEIAYYH